MKQVSDKALVEQVAANGSHLAFAELLRRYQHDIRRFLLSLTHGDGQLTDDLAQEAFIKAYQRMGQCEKGEQIKSWLYTIAHRCFFDYIRGKKMTEDIVESSEAPVERSDERGVSAQMDVQWAMRQLSQAEHLCITLFYMEDQPIDKIAEITTFKSSTIKSHLRRAKEKMASSLSQQGYGPSDIY